MVNRDALNQVVHSVRYDALRLRARLLQRVPRRGVASERLHLGCGTRRVAGWLNVDVYGSDHDVDLTAASLPWADGTFEVVLSQHVIEHFRLETDLIPLLREVRRVTREGGEFWVSCPDIAKICAGYVKDRAQTLIDRRQERAPTWSMKGVPSSHMVNLLFHQNGEHKNLFDFELLRWTLEQAGFGQVEERTEAELLARFPEIRPRNDEEQTLLVRAIAGRDAG